MFKNFFLTAYRQAIKSKFYTALNITALTIGLTCFYLLMTFVINELSYDKFHKDSENIYRIASFGNIAGREMKIAASPHAIGQTLMREFPSDVDKYTCFSVLNEDNRIALSYNGYSYYESKGFYCDSNFLKVFSFELTKGNRETAFALPNSILISETMERKYFGGESGLGKILRCDNNRDLTVTGVFQNVPDNSHMKFDMLLSLDYKRADSRPPLSQWMDYSYYTYIMLKPEADPKRLNAEMPAFINKHSKQYFDMAGGVTITPFLQPLTDIHLKSNYGWEIGPNYSIENVYIFIAIAVLILVIAFFNYFNLTTARAEIRAKEISMKKILGASKARLFVQFIFESVMYVLFASFLAIAVIQIIMPLFNMLIGRNLEFNSALMYWSLLSSLLLGAASGFSPAAYFTSFESAAILRKEPLFKGKSKVSFRNVLTLSQFAITITMIIGAIVVFKQLSYLNKKELGFNKNSIIVFPMKFGGDIDGVKNMFLSVPGVIKCGASSSSPGDKTSQQLFQPESKGESVILQRIDVDYDFFDVYGIKLIEGRKFAREFGADQDNSIIINEKTARTNNFVHPLETSFKSYDDTRTYNVIGVVKDFHFNSLHLPIQSMAFMLKPYNFNYLSVKIENADFNGTLKKIERKYKELFPIGEFQFTVLDDKLNRLYLNDYKLGEAALIFTCISLALSLLGLVGLVSFTSERKARENSIRKILGANVKQIYFKDLKEYLILIGMASVIAIPVAFYVMRTWLGGYAYHTDLGILPFIAGGALTLCAVVLSVTFHILRASSGSLTKYLCER